MASLFDRHLEEQTLTFSVDEAGRIHDDQTGSVWNVFGTAIEGTQAGNQLTQVLAFPHFWFAWAAFQPATAIYSPTP